MFKSLAEKEKITFNFIFDWTSHEDSKDVSTRNYTTDKNL